MDKFAFASATADSVEALATELLAKLGTVNDTANLGFIYATDSTAPMLNDLVGKLRDATGIENWSGTLGLGLAVTGAEIYEQPAVGIMLGSFSNDEFRIIDPQAIDVSGFTTSHGDWLDHDDHYFGVVHGDPSNGRCAGLLNALADTIPNSFLVGGMTSSSSQNLQVANTVTSGGLSGVLFSSRIPVVTSHSQGCSPISASHVVTQCQQNIAIELDGRPALEVLREDVGEIIAQDLQRMAGYIFAALPIPGSDTGDYLVRNIVGVDEQQNLIGIGELLSEGMELLFCRRDGKSAREDLERMLEDVSRRAGSEARGALYYSCLARGRNQFGENSEELCMISEALGDLPLVGFFANGEIFHNRLYAYTGVLSVFC